MATFATVLRSGGRYHAGWIAALHEAVRRHGPAFDRFVALTDVAIDRDGIETVPLLRDWPGWWSKFEAFRTGLFSGTVVLSDLDVILSGSIDALAEPEPAILEDLLLTGRASSALMRWRGDGFTHLYESFRRRPDAWMRPGSCAEVPNAVHGDQVVIDHLLRRTGARPPFLQDRHPGLVAGFDAEKLRQAPVAIFIGETKPRLVGTSLVAPERHVM